MMYDIKLQHIDQFAFIEGRSFLKLEGEGKSAVVALDEVSSVMEGKCLCLLG